MSEESTEPTAESTEPTEAQQQGDPAANEPLGEGGKKALQAERIRAADLEKQLKAATEKLTQIERASETALEKAQREAKEAQDALPGLTAAAFKDAAIKFGGISQEDADLFLTGADVETLSKQAARLAERTTSSTPGTPKPDATQGGKSDLKKKSVAEQFADWSDQAFVM